MKYRLLLVGAMAVVVVFFQNCGVSNFSVETQSPLSSGDSPTIVGIIPTEPEPQSDRTNFISYLKIGAYQGEGASREELTILKSDDGDWVIQGVDYPTVGVGGGCHTAPMTLSQVDVDHLVEARNKLIIMTKDDIGVLMDQEIETVTFGSDEGVGDRIHLTESSVMSDAKGAKYATNSDELRQFFTDIYQRFKMGTACNN